MPRDRVKYVCQGETPIRAVTKKDAVEEAGAARKRNISPPAKRRMRISIEDGIHVGLRMDNPDRGLGGRVVK